MEYIFKRDTWIRWLEANPVLPKGCIGRVDPGGKFKLGDGVTRWSDLPYRTTLPERITLYGVRS